MENARRCADIVVDSANDRGCRAAADWTIRRRLRLALAALASLGLVACSTPEPRVVYKTVPTPIYQPCKVNADVLDPKFPLDAGPIANDIAQAVKDLHADRKARQAWTVEAIAELKGCAG
jgi:hypothetical protein